MKKALSFPEEIPDNSELPGLELMLHDRQVPDIEIAAKLLEYYEELAYQKAFIVYFDPQIARRSALFILATAVARRYEYWADVPLDEWLEGIVEQVLIKKPEPGPDWDDRESIPKAIEAAALRLRNVQKKVRFYQTFFLAGVIPLSILFALVWFAFPDLDATSFITALRGEARSYYIYEVQPGDSLEIISRKTGVSADVIADLNPGINFKTLAIPPKEDFPWNLYRVKVPATSHHSTFDEKIINFVPEINFQPVLTVHSSPESVLGRIRSSEDTNHSLFADFWITAYPMPGLVSNAQHFRDLLWQRKPGLIKYFYLDPENQIVWGVFQDEDRYYTITNGNNVTGRTTEPEVMLYFQGDGYQYFQPLFAPLYLDVQEKGATLKVLGSETVAGRESLVVDWYNAQGNRTHRLWVDSVSGLPLAWRLYGGADYQSPLFDMRSADVHISMKLGDEIFDPSLISSSNIANSGPEWEKYPGELNWAQLKPFPSTRQPPPPEFEPAKGRLSIQWSEDNAIFPLENDPGRLHQVNIYSDEYFLGSLDLGPDVRVASPAGCARSPGGNLVAFGIYSNDTNMSVLYWFSLNNWAELHRVVKESGSQPSVFAFSPDGEHLAFSDCKQECYINIYDFSTGQSRPFVKLSNIMGRLVFSPDGSQLATLTINLSGKGSLYELGIYDLASGLQLYFGPFDALNWRPESDAPVESWGYGYLEWAPEYTGCAAPE